MDVGFIGAGSIAQVHLQNLDQFDNVAVTAVCDVDERRAETVASARSGETETYTDHEKLLAEADLDAVFVAIPPTAHTNQVSMAAERGIDLFIEKPLPLNGDQARRFRDAIEDAGVLSQVGYMFRYAPLVERAKELIEDRTLSLIEGHWLSGVPEAGWWRQRDLSGGQVVATTTHVYDLARYFGGEAVAVSAHGGQRIVTDAIDFEDSHGATVHHENGVVSQVASTCTVPDDRHVDMTLVGDEFRLSLDFNERTLNGTVDGEPVSYAEPEPEFEGEQLDYYDPFTFLWRRDYYNEIEAFVEAVRTGDESLLRSPFADAFRTHALTTSVNQSLETGDSIQVG
ncbi:Gfo/Idh/MocA family protein [Halosimplex amylolyticum]|uniref:Gfo/Idh/MocA family protein n=1 Tax=Halosimplex amylolyticum TaxID=3396616 RepID=UPI003F54FB95